MKRTICPVYFVVFDHTRIVQHVCIPKIPHLTQVPVIHDSHQKLAIGYALLHFTNTIVTHKPLQITRHIVTQQNFFWNAEAFLLAQLAANEH